MAERDFLVIYEESDPDGLPAGDSLVLDIESGRTPTLGELDVEQKVDLKLSNTRNRVGTSGFVLSCVGAVLGVGLMAAFSLIYPQDWYGGGASTVRTTILLAIVALLLLLAGTVLTHYGRRIQAHGSVSQVRIVEKTAQARARFE